MSQDVRMSEGVNDVKAIDDGLTNGFVPYSAVGFVDATQNFVRSSSSNPLPVTISGSSVSLTVADGVDVDVASVNDFTLSMGQQTAASSFPVVLPANTVSVPAITSPVLSSTSGNASSAAANIAANIVGANKVFKGNVNLALSATQGASVNAAGSSKLIVSWVPGSGGTASSNVAELDVSFAAFGTSSGDSDSVATSVPCCVYAGTTAGTFQAAVTETGTITSRLWAASVTGIAQ